MENNKSTDFQSLESKVKLSKGEFRFEEARKSLEQDFPQVEDYVNILTE